MAIGAGVAGEFGTRLGWPFPAVVLLAGLAGGLIGLIVGLPSLRLRGVYLLVATLALQYLAAFGFQEFQAHTVGEAGFTAPTPSLFGFTIDTPSRWYYTLLVIAVLLALGYANLMRSTTGRAWLLIQERDLAAEVLGIDVSRAKIAVFVTSSFVIGLQGALYAYYVGVTTYDQFSLTLAISYVAMILIGGLGSLAGAIYGALFVSALPYILEQLSQHVAPDSVWLQQHTSDLQTLVYGLSIVIFLLFEPKGLVAVTGRIRASVERWPFGRDRQQEAREW
jgi:branched-chain amino acid transport system permease protein